MSTVLGPCSCDVFIVCGNSIGDAATTCKK
jgi:hypothetical protein